jgi:hypothetical protein
MIVPTLRVGMPLWTLRVRSGEVTRSVGGCMPTRSVGTIGMVLEDECNSTVGAGLLAKAFVQPTSSYLRRRVRQQAGSYRNRAQAAASEKRGGNDQQQQHSRASSLPQRGGVGSRMWATGLASSRLKPVLQKHRRRPVGLAVTSTVGPASAGKLLICAALLIFIRKRLKHHTSRLGCRLNGGFAQWAERHGCRESRPPPWMADGGGPTERDRSEGTRRSRAQPRASTFGYF